MTPAAAARNTRKLQRCRALPLVDVRGDEHGRPTILRIRDAGGKPRSEACADIESCDARRRQLVASGYLDAGALTTPAAWATMCTAGLEVYSRDGVRHQVRRYTGSSWRVDGQYETQAELDARWAELEDSDTAICL